jgi:hypothetical protein
LASLKRPTMIDATAKRTAAIKATAIRRASDFLPERRQPDALKAGRPRGPIGREVAARPSEIVRAPRWDHYRCLRALIGYGIDRGS